MAEHSVDPRTLAGDPFPAAAQDQDHPHACNDGWVTIGQLALNAEMGEEQEEYAMYLCRKCAERR